MLKYALFFAAFVAFASCTSEINFGRQTTRFIMTYYIDHLTKLLAEFDINIDRFLGNVEKMASLVSPAVASCVHEGATSIQKPLVEKVNEVLGAEENKILDVLKTLDNLNEDQVDKLWTSVSKDGTFRDEMNAVITDLKQLVFHELTNFRKQITSKCTPVTEQIALNRVWS